MSEPRALRRDSFLFPVVGNQTRHQLFEIWELSVLSQRSKFWTQSPLNKPRHHTNRGSDPCATTAFVLLFLLPLSPPSPPLPRLPRRPMTGFGMSPS